MAEKKFPSVPSNYVSILQLQERWIKQKQLEKEKQEQQQEQQRRREDEEEEEQTRLKQEQQRRREDDEKEEERKRLKQVQEDDQKNKRDGKRRCEEPTVAPAPSRKTPTPYHRRNIVAASRTKPEEAGKVKDEADFEAKPEQVVVVVGEVVRDGEGKTDDAKGKRKKRYSKKGKYKKEEAVIGDLEPVMEVVAVEEEKNVPARRNSEGKGKRSEWRWKSVNAVANGKVVEAKDDPTVEIGDKLEEVELEQKFGELSVNRRKGEGKEKARLRFQRSGGGGRRKEEAVVGDMEPVMEVVVVEEESVPARRNTGRKEKQSEWRSKSENAVANGKVVEAKDDPTVDIGEKLEEVELEQKFGELSVNRRKGEGKEKARLRFERNGGSDGGGGRRMDSGRFGGGLERGVRRPSYGSFVWVKKEEVPDGNIA